MSENMKNEAVKNAPVKKTKKRRKPMAWFKRYFRILFGGLMLVVIFFFVFLGPVITPHDPDTVDMNNRYAGPSAEHWLGTDQFGRDYFARLAVGGMPTIAIALIAQVLILALGIVLGLLCGYYRPFDNVCMRIMEAIQNIPSLLTTIILADLVRGAFEKVEGMGNIALVSGMISVIVALVLSGITSITRNLRGQVLRLRSLEFIEAEKAMGAGPFRTIFMHILPQTMNYLVIRFGTGISSLVLTTASLSYLGIGLPTSTPNWGAMVSEGQSVMLLHPNMIIWPGVCIVVLVFGFSLMGEGLRDVLDPKYR